KAADFKWRITVIRALEHNVDGIDTLLQIMHDETDDPYMRGEAIGPLGSYRGEAAGRVVPSLIEGVSHPIFDICYWSVVALAEIGRRTENMQLFIESGAFAALNRIAADEPTTAPGSLNIHASAIRGIEEFNHVVRQVWPRYDVGSYILSPILYRDPAFKSPKLQPQPDQPTPPLTFSGWSITPDEFAKHVKKRLKRVKFNTRQPSADFLLIDFEYKTRTYYLSGGLHRNGHTLTLNGEPESAAKFAVWWRTLFPPEYTLYLDAREFGFVSVEPSTTETNILDVIDPHHANRAALLAAENDAQESEG
ncbi:MAG: HEAT repeat domain-containing protein, partial [Burkholderiales bacterium]|nr:HEAT repeat domain-containing protein [Anaerolineae bacterium]